MLRPLLLLFVSVASPVAAEGVGARHGYAVDAASAARPDQVVRGRVEGREARFRGDAARVGARVYFDPDGTAETEARAAVTVARGTRIAGGGGGRFREDDPSVGFDVGVSPLLAELCRFDLRYRDAIAADPRAEASLKVGF